MHNRHCLFMRWYWRLLAEAEDRRRQQAECLAPEAAVERAQLEAQERSAAAAAAAKAAAAQAQLEKANVGKGHPRVARLKGGDASLVGVLS